MSNFVSLRTLAREVWRSVQDKTPGASYTVMIVPDETSRVVRTCFPKKAVRRTMLATGLCALLLGVLAVDYVGAKAKVSEVERLRRETRQQKQELASFAKSMGDLQDQIAKLREFDAKLRVMTDLDAAKYGGPEASADAPAEQAGVAVGGMNPELVNPLREEISSQDEEVLRNLSSGLARLQDETEAQNKSFAELVDSLEDQRALLASTPSVWPVRGWLTSSFGGRSSPFTGGREYHSGLDIATRSGTPIVAPADGVVTFIGREGGYGITLEMDHGYGIKTRYGHLSQTVVRPGARVKRGEVVARVGSTGRSTGPHLHYEVAVNGVRVNPLRYILN